MLHSMACGMRCRHDPVDGKKLKASGISADFESGLKAVVVRQAVCVEVSEIACELVRQFPPVPDTRSGVRRLMMSKILSKKRRKMAPAYIATTLAKTKACVHDIPGHELLGNPVRMRAKYFANNTHVCVCMYIRVPNTKEFVPGTPSLPRPR